MMINQTLEAFFTYNHCKGCLFTNFLAGKQSILMSVCLSVYLSVCLFVGERITKFYAHSTTVVAPLFSFGAACIQYVLWVWVSSSLQITVRKGRDENSAHSIRLTAGNITPGPEYDVYDFLVLWCD